MQLHKPHDRVNTRVTPTAFAFAFPFRPMLTSLPENFWQWCVRATPLQRLLGINVAATNLLTLDFQRVVDAKQKTGVIIG